MELKDYKLVIKSGLNSYDDKKYYLKYSYINLITGYIMVSGFKTSDSLLKVYNEIVNEFIDRV